MNLQYVSGEYISDSRTPYPIAVSVWQRPRHPCFQYSSGIIFEKDESHFTCPHTRYRNLPFDLTSVQPISQRKNRLANRTISERSFLLTSELNTIVVVDHIWPLSKLQLFYLIHYSYIDDSIITHPILNMTNCLCFIEVGASRTYDS